MPFTTIPTQAGPYLNETYVFPALVEAVGSGRMILIRPNGVGGATVEISYGDGARDELAAGQFDVAEYGSGSNLLTAFRYALGAHFHSEE